MFKKIPKILAHSSAIDTGNFVTPEYILSNNESALFHRYCPHRRYPMHEIGEVIKETITCNFHGFKWNINGDPINNKKQLSCGKYVKGKSNLLFQNLSEPDAKWVDDLATEKNLAFSHSYHGRSNGSWLWMMDIQADLLHIRRGEGVVHPELSNITDLSEIELESGNGWAIQKFAQGWWLCIYPYTFVEYSKGCLAINYAIPEDSHTEFKFTWFTQFYFDYSITTLERRQDFEKYFQDVFLEDIQVIEKQKGKYFPLTQKVNELENHCIHFGEWYIENLTKN